MTIEDIYEEKNEELFDLTKIMSLFIRMWYWFLLFGILGLSAAYTYMTYKGKTYTVSTSILIPENSGSTDMRRMIQGPNLEQPKNNIFNQIEFINSYSNINNTILNLNWRTFVFRKNNLNWRGIYKSEPFEVQQPDSFSNPKGIPIFITPVTEDSYNLSVNAKINKNHKVSEVKFTRRGEFGIPFTNEYFSFTLAKNPKNPFVRGEFYYFVFNDLDKTTLNYQRRLKTGLMDKKSDVIRCSIEGEDPVRESDFLNKLINEFIEKKVSSQNEVQLRTLEFLNTQLSGISDSLNSTGTRFSNFRSKNNIIDLGTEGTLIMNNLKELEAAKAQSQIQLEYFHNLLSYLNSKGDLNKIVSPSVVGIQDASLNSLVVKLGELYNHRQVLSFSATENNITMKQLDRELLETKDRLNENLQNLIDNSTKSIEGLNDRISVIKTNLNRLPQKEQQMVNIKQQYNLTNEIYTFLLQKRAEANIILASTIPDIQIVDTARPETAIPTGLTGKQILILGFFIGIFIPFGFNRIINLLNVNINTLEDIQKYTNLPVVGSIMHDHSKKELIVNEEPGSIIAESFRALRTNIQFMVGGTEGEIISIHSLSPNEGKTFIARNLALILAMNDKKILLIGADLRRPKMHVKFNISNEHGLSTYLIGKDKLEEVILPSQVNNLYLLPSGPIPPNPSEIIGKSEMKILIQKARQQFDYVIFDNAPLALVTDGLIISHLSDLNLLILRYGKSHKHQVKMIDQFAAKRTISHIAIVINDIKGSTFGHPYYNYKDYGTYTKSYQEKGPVKKSRTKKAEI